MYINYYFELNREGAGLKVRLGEWDAKANVEPLKYVELNVIRQKVILLIKNPFYS